MKQFDIKIFYIDFLDDFFLNEGKNNSLLDKSLRNLLIKDILHLSHEKEIEFIANHFYLLNEEQISSIYSMKKINIDER